MSLALGWQLSLSLSFSFEVRLDAQAFPYVVCSFCPKLRKIKKTISMGGPTSLIALSLGMFHERDIYV